MLRKGNRGPRAARHCRGQAVLALFLALGILVGALAPAPVVADSGGTRPAAEPTMQQRDSDLTAQVVGGHPVAAGQYPFMASIRIRTPEGTFMCGGTLIGARQILTAAHCATNGAGQAYGSQAFTVVLGVVDLRNRSRCDNCVYRVGAVRVHPDWNPRTTNMDAAVLTLTRRVPAGVASPITLVDTTPGALDDPGRAAVVAGWGHTSSGGTGAQHLQAATLSIVGDRACAASYPAGEVKKGSMLCAAASGRDSCQGDSGGPLFVRQATRDGKTRFVQIGITSWGYGCAEPGYPGVYSRLSNQSINAFVRRSLK